MLKNNEVFCTHKINIKNLNDGDIITHTLLLIRGLVSPINNCTSLIHLSDGEQNLSEKPVNGEFKFILDLSCYFDAKKLPITLHFKFCNTEVQLQLILNFQKGVYRLQPLYILCDEEESTLAELHSKIIDLNLRLIQALYADRLNEAGFSRKSFTLNGDCTIFRSDLKKTDALAADEQTLWRYFAEEFLRKNLFQGNDNCKLKLVAFIGCTNYDGAAVVASGDTSYANIKKHLKAHAALGGGDLALFGSAYFYAWPHEVKQILPCLLNKREVDIAKEADESNYRRTYAGVYATTLGAICHEIGHIFDLGHDDYGIMGTGFDYANRVLIYNNRTENLPKRIVGNTFATKFIAIKNTPNLRFTQLKRDSNAFLENYREQQKYDGFYFTRNCALILEHHIWFNNLKTIEEYDKKNSITFNFDTGLIKSSYEMLKIIEIRSNANSHVDCFYELKNNEALEFKIPSDVLIVRKNTHHIYVMTTGGLSQRLELIS